LVGGDEEGHVVVAGFELDLELEHPEEERGEAKNEAVGAGIELGGQLADTAVSVRHGLREELVATVEANGNSLRRAAPLRVEDVRRKGDAHRPTSGL
jgi:hypothetical protein